MNENYINDYNEFKRLRKLHSANPSDVASVVNLHSKYIAPCSICMSCPRQVQAIFDRVKTYFESREVEIEKIIQLNSDLTIIDSLRRINDWEQNQIELLENMYNKYVVVGDNVKITKHYYKYRDELIEFYKQEMKKQK
jgi:hypothetical protein